MPAAELDPRAARYLATIPHGAAFAPAAGALVDALSTPFAVDPDALLEVDAASACDAGLEAAMVHALLLADWAMYPVDHDRATLEQLTTGVQSYAQGFHLLLSPRGEELAPVGYTGLHGVPTAFFDAAAAGSLVLPTRDLPACAPDPAAPCFYIFNYSVLPWLRGTEVSKRMLRAFAARLKALVPAGLLAITVSDDGARVTSRFGLSRVSLVGGGPDVLWATPPRPR